MTTNVETVKENESKTKNTKRSALQKKKVVKGSPARSRASGNLGCISAPPVVTDSYAGRWIATAGGQREKRLLIVGQKFICNVSKKHIDAPECWTCLYH